jgi:hypothetical protein
MPTDFAEVKRLILQLQRDWLLKRTCEYFWSTPAGQSSVIGRNCEPLKRGSKDGQSLLAEFGDGTHDGIINTSVQADAFPYGDRVVHVVRQRGDGVTDIAIILQDLQHRQTLKALDIGIVPWPAF